MEILLSFMVALGSKYQTQNFPSKRLLRPWFISPECCGTSLGSLGRVCLFFLFWVPMKEWGMVLKEIKSKKGWWLEAFRRLPMSLPSHAFFWEMMVMIMMLLYFWVSVGRLHEPAQRLLVPLFCLLTNSSKYSFSLLSGVPVPMPVLKFPIRVTFLFCRELLYLSH